MSTASLPLSGCLVLDLSQGVCGPFCTRIAADLGADVVKIERPGLGDPARRVPPFRGHAPHLETGAWFLYLNGNKRSVTLDLKSATGVRLFRELARAADAVVESFRPGAMERFGLEYSSLAAVNPRVVMLSISSFGQSGPYRDYAASHAALLALSGYLYGVGEPGREPLQLGQHLGLMFAGQRAAMALLAALAARSRSGRGQHVDFSIMEALHDCLQAPTASISMMGRYPHERLGNRFPGVFKCLDGYVGMNALTQQQWEGLCLLIGRPELAEDPRLQTREGKYAHGDDVRAVVGEWVKDKTCIEIFSAGQELRVPIGLAPTVGELPDLPQHRERQAFSSLVHPAAGEVLVPGPPFRMPRSPLRRLGPAPRLGEHTQEVLCGRLGLSLEELARLKRHGVI